jgi:hypothetical protein
VNPWRIGGQAVLHVEHGGQWRVVDLHGLSHIFGEITRGRHDSHDRLPTEGDGVVGQRIAIVAPGIGVHRWLTRAHRMDVWQEIRRS